jgi:replicative DNA helicase
VEKLLPQNIEAESGVLGSIIIDPEAIVQVSDFLLPEDFYRDAHRSIYETILHLYQNGEPADFITICDELERRNQLEDVGGASYITSLINQVPTSGNVEYYGHIVERTSTLRRLIHAAGQIAAVAYEESDADAALDKAEQLIFAISQRHSHSDFSSIEDILTSYMNKLEQLNERRGSIVGVPTGFTDMDRMMGGLQKSDLIILAARPGVGKCLTAHTLVDDPTTGERLTIETCVKRQLSFVYGLSEAGQVRATQVSAWINSGVQPCYRVRTHQGREVEVTGHHPFLTIHGWIPLHNLHVGDQIAIPRQVPAFGQDQSWSLEKVRLLAYYLAESAIPQKQLAYSAARHEENSHRSLLAQHEELPVTSRLQAFGLCGKAADSLVFPACVWQWDKRRLAEFLHALMSRMGSIFVQDKDHPCIEFAATSPQLVADVSHAFVRFGIVSRYFQTAQGLWSTQITSALESARYQAEIGWLGENSRSGADTRIEKYTAVNGASDQAIYWDIILAIEPIGEQQVYDLSVPDGNNFVAQDIFVHNTSFALSMAHNAAVKYKHSVAFFSLEMSKEQLAQRLLSMDAGIDQQRLRTGWIEEDEWVRIVEAGDKLSESSIWIDDTAGLSVMEMRSKARRLQAEHGVDLVVVDYLQLMQARPGSGGRSENRVQEVSEISRNLKGLAREMNVPVMALAQLSRSVESRQSKVPQLSDLRESGCLTGDTCVYLPAKGSHERIDSLVGKSGFAVLALNPVTWTLERKNVSHAFSTGEKPVYRMTTRKGNSIRATANHKFLTVTRWKRLDEIEPGTHIALPDPTELTGTQSAYAGTSIYKRGMSREGTSCVAAVAQAAELSLLSQGDIYWDEVISIVPDGEEAVYDLTVDDHHNFVANNVLVHNSIEQDADIVMFIYRDDVYNQDSERKNIADVIVAKHRNGPVGEISLYFQASQTRFRDLEVAPGEE